MHISGFPSCCGASIISGFPYTTYDTLTREMENWNRTYPNTYLLTSKYEGYIKDLLDSVAHYPYNLAILTDQQTALNEPMLRKFGFIKVTENVYNYAHYLNIYVRMNGNRIDYGNKTTRYHDLFTNTTRG